MSYPYDKRYLDKIRENKAECKAIESAYYTLLKKYCKDNKTDDITLSLQEQFALLGEAFELESHTVGDATDIYHFIWDVIEELLTPTEAKDGE